MTRYNYKYIMMSFAIAASFASCADIDDQNPAGYVITDEQKSQTVEAVPERVKADVAGMYTMMGKMGTYFGEDGNGNYPRDDDGGYPSVCLSNDLNGPDMVSDNSGYNWFSVASEYTDRTPNYANPRMRYGLFYNQIKAANDIIASIGETTEETALKQYLGQAKACRAFSYLNLVPYFQFNYKTSADKPAVPLVLETTTDYSNNPRATVAEIYTQIEKDLLSARELLDGFTPSDNSYVTKAVCDGLLARTYLSMGEYAKAAEYAQYAIDESGATPATREEVSHPYFYDKSEHNWMWSIAVSTSDVVNFGGPSWPSQLGSFSGNSYTAYASLYRRINPLLFNKISSTDIRKQWWLDENRYSSLLDGLSWTGIVKDGSTVTATGQDIVDAVYPDVKTAFTTYTNVKFGMKSGIGSTTNNNDWPLMRVEEMYLIKAEGLAMSGSLGTGKLVLEDFVKAYRDPSYTCTASDEKSFQNEVWFQRRVELWGEGFSMFDIMRLGKPVVRFHGSDKGIWPDAFCFNIQANDGYLLMRFSQKETNNNSAIVNNTEGTLPSSMQNPNLTDGVTD